MYDAAIAGRDVVGHFSHFRELLMDAERLLGRLAHRADVRRSGR
jgi:hypothetical protein